MQYEQFPHSPEQNRQQLDAEMISGAGTALAIGGAILAGAGEMLNSTTLTGVGLGTFSIGNILMYSPSESRLGRVARECVRVSIEWVENISGGTSES